VRDRELTDVQVYSNWAVLSEASNNNDFIMRRRRDSVKQVELAAVLVAAL